MKKLNFEYESNELEITILGKTYKVDGGSYENYKASEEYSERVDTAIAKFQKDGGVDELIEFCESVIEMFTSDFKRIWDACNHNVNFVVGVTTALIKEVAESRTAAISAYV